MKVTFTFTKPGCVTFDVPSDTKWSVSGEEVAPATPVVPDTTEAARQQAAFEGSGKLSDARTDFAALRTIRLVFDSPNPTRDEIKNTLELSGVNGDEFIGLFVANGGTSGVAKAIVAGINLSLATRHEA